MHPTEDRFATTSAASLHPRGGERFARRSNGQALSHALGWVSLGLGGAAIGAPQTVAHVTGVGEHPLLLRLVGLREMASGLGILAGRLTTGVLSRVAGDAMDLALLGAALRATAGPRHRRVVAATAVVAGITALDVLASRRRLEADRFPH